MAYKLMLKLIQNLEKGKGSYTKERLMEMLDVYYGAGRVTDQQYEELMERLNAIEE